MPILTLIQIRFEQQNPIHIKDVAGVCPPTPLRFGSMDLLHSVHGITLSICSYGWQKTTILQRGFRGTVG